MCARFTDRPVCDGVGKAPPLSLFFTPSNPSERGEPEQALSPPAFHSLYVDAFPFSLRNYRWIILTAAGRTNKTSTTPVDKAQRGYVKELMKALG
uniref:SOS response associated peptidase (SRAP) n=1 Tax=Mesocestoides corti TaxID=53468 RepID=A0A5K3FT91_MESCO